MNDAEHRQLRDLLGAFTLGHLDPDNAAALQAHLDGCSTCRGELEEIAPLATALRGVDPARLGDIGAPSPDLGQRIFDEVGEQRSQRDQSRLAGRAVVGAVAAAALVAAFLLGVRVDDATNDQAQPPAKTPPVEAISVQTPGAGIDASAGLVAHTWGTEVKLEATGLRDGATYRAWFTDTDGVRTTAGTFLGTGADAVKCSLNAALLRPAATDLTITDVSGSVVMTADLA